MKNTVIYHSADYDGIFCREIARRFLPPETEFIGWNFGDAKIPMPPTGTVYIMDLPPDCLSDESLFQPSRIVWIDHHKTSIEKWSVAEIPGYRIDGVAACRLAWQWFVREQILNNRRGITTDEIIPLPDKQEFIDRKVDEPLAVRLAGEYDVWDHRGDGDLELQYGLKSEEKPDFQRLLCDGGEGIRPSTYLDRLLSQGKTCMQYAKNMDAMWLSESWHIIEFEGLKFLAQNSVQRGSGILDSKDIPDTGHDALMLYGFRGKLWTVSMYHSAVYRKNELDLSVIAKKHGGGGHKGACGFTCQKLPFLP